MSNYINSKFKNKMAYFGLIISPKTNYLAITFI